MSRILLAAPPLAVLLACARPPIEWQDPVTVPPETTPNRPLSSAESSALQLGGRCPKTVRVARDTTGNAYYAVWWGVRPDSTADLMVAHSADGLSWDVPVRVDTLDTAPVACRRMPPAIAAEGGAVHVAYAMAAREGPGIFASHSMDRGRMFHSPVAVVYGERIGKTAIAARGNLVVVGYEDPNTVPRRIGIAMSGTMGHPFQTRMLVSPPTGEASAPSVSLADSTITVTWTSVPRGSAVPSRLMRRGTIR